METAPKGPYVYQPFGPVSHPELRLQERYYAIGGLPSPARISGLTKLEANMVLEALRIAARIVDELHDATEIEE